MRCVIEGEEIDRASIGPPFMNYGQHNRWADTPKVQFTFEFTITDFVNELGGWFEEFRQELSDQDEDWSSAELDRFIEIGCPSLADLMELDVPLLGELIKWNEYEVHHALHRPSESVPSRYSANSIDEVWRNGDCICINGIAYRIG